MSTQIKPHELCTSCLSVADGFAGNVLISDGYITKGALNQVLVNNMILINLQNKGGCPSCIAVVNRYVNG